MNQDVFNVKANKKRPAVIGSARLQYNIATDSHRQNSEKLDVESHRESQSQFQIGKITKTVKKDEINNDQKKAKDEAQQPAVDEQNSNDSDTSLELSEYLS